MKFIFVLLLILTVLSGHAQMKVGINPTSNADLLLELESANKGLMIHQISLTNTTTWGGIPVAGMHINNTNASITSTNTSYPILAAKIGDYYWDGTGWVVVEPLLKLAVITSFTQPVGIVFTIPTGCTICLSTTSPLACATDINLNGTFTIVNSSSKVVITSESSLHRLSCPQPSIWDVDKAILLNSRRV